MTVDLSKCEVGKHYLIKDNQHNKDGHIGQFAGIKNGGYYFKFQEIRISVHHEQWDVSGKPERMMHKDYGIVSIEPAPTRIHIDMTEDQLRSIIRYHLGRVEWTGNSQGTEDAFIEALKGAGK